MEFLFGLIVAAAIIYALYKTLTSAATTGIKVIWVLVLLFLPILGFIAWLIFGPKERTQPL